MTRAAQSMLPLTRIHDCHLSGSDSGPFVELRFSLPSTIAAVSPTVDRLMSLIAASRIADGSETEIEIALREALVNAVVHGNREQADKRVEIACRCSADGEVFITIHDEGMGFDANAVPDPTAAENRMLTHGRGICLMRALMDEVSFEEDGTVVLLHKKPNRR